MRIKYNTSRVGEGTSWAITREPAPGEVSPGLTGQWGGGDR